MIRLVLGLLTLAAYEAPVLRAQDPGEPKGGSFDTDTLAAYRSICDGNVTTPPYDPSTQLSLVAAYDQKDNKVNPEFFSESVVESDLRAVSPRVARWLVCLGRGTEYRFDFKTKAGARIPAHRNVWRVRLFDLKKTDQTPVAVTFFGKDPPATIYLLGSSGGPVTGSAPTQEVRGWVRRNVVPPDNGVQPSTAPRNP